MLLAFGGIKRPTRGPELGRSYTRHTKPLRYLRMLGRICCEMHVAACVIIMNCLHGLQTISRNTAVISMRFSGLRSRSMNYGACVRRTRVEVS